MHRAHNRSSGCRSTGWHFKILFTVLALVCLIVGMIGIVLPVIPGVIFLIVAMLLLSRVSPRVARWVKQKPEMNRMQDRFDSMGRMRWGERLRLSFWMAMSGVVQGAVLIGSIFSRTSRYIRNRRPRRLTFSD